MPLGLISSRAAACALACALAVCARAQGGADAGGLTPLELLGRRVFEDKSLSRPEGVSCASCHDPAKAFQGDNGSTVAGVARGSRPDSLGTRNTPSIMYATFTPPFAFVEEKDEKTGKIETAPVGGQFLDGRASDLLAQVEGPMLNPVEMNMPSKRAVVEAVRAGAYADLARQVYGEKIFADPDAAFEKLAQAVVAFESTPRFHPFASKFDDFLRGRAKLTPIEEKGLALFKDPKKGNCIACHVGKEGSIDPKAWLFTDFTYDAFGAPKNRAIPSNAEAAADLGLCKQPGIEKVAPKGFEIESVCGAFKVPTLRNVAITGPYLHNGVFAKLRDVVAFYATRDTSPEHWYPKGAKDEIEKFDDLPAQHRANVNFDEVPYDRKLRQRPRLSDKEVDAIVAFLETLTDRREQ